ncbi:MAG: hypothetical protein H7296_08650 [Bacteroidia bacterium]|nr:hypothetical protein [Bacteroidia bacterium]
MKKILLLTAFAGLTMASCKKDRVCTCSDSNGTSTTTLVHVSKAQAKANCISTSQTENGVTYSNMCSLN